MRLAVSVGDTRGVGPEVAVRASLSAHVLSVCTPVLFWPRALGGPPEDLECRLVGEKEDSPARAALASLGAALEDVRGGNCHGLVTAPVNKERMASVVPGFTGHTDWLAYRTGVDPADVLMIFSGPKVVTGCVTRHVPLSDVPASLTTGRVAFCALLLWGHLRYHMGLTGPRVAVCGLNPHASDGGLLGDEERTVIEPAVHRASGALERLGEGGSIAGPLAADAAYRAHVMGDLDGVLAMYHDQATVAAKIADPFVSVNLSAGLPLVRTSPDHGTADDVAGTGRADDGSMSAAMVLAARACSREPGLEASVPLLRQALGD